MFNQIISLGQSLRQREAGSWPIIGFANGSGQHREDLLPMGQAGEMFTFLHPGVAGGVDVAVVLLQDLNLGHPPNNRDQVGTYISRQIIRVHYLKGVKLQIEILRSR